MKYLLVFSLFSVTLLAQTYKELPVKNSNSSAADIMEVKKLEARLVSKVGEYGNFENRSLEIDLGIKAIASACEEFVEVEYVSAQSSLESALNPSDFYLRVNTRWEPGCATGSFGSPDYIKLTLNYSIGQRPVSEKGKPWPKPNFFAGSNVRHLSFDSGMMGGLNRWKLYRLDYSDVKDVKFDFVKQYSYVQGESVEK